MVNTEKLKDEIIAAGFTQKNVYEYIGLSRRQWAIRIKNKAFSSDEIYALINLLGRHLLPIFFED